MKDEILNLAKECGFSVENNDLNPQASALFKVIVMSKLEKFYVGAYNKGVLRSAIAARNFWSNQLDQTEESAYDEIRSLELK
jgi:hypothetical protein